MVVGKERVLAGPRTVTAKQTAGEGRAGTAAPSGARRRWPRSPASACGCGLRDYGACGRRPADAGGLFVKRVGPDRNRGRDGWVYKVGPQGRHRLRRRPGGTVRDRPAPARRRPPAVVLVRTQSSGGCQRTLEATPDRTVAVAGEALRVTVRGYDDTGRGKAVAGATVRLGAASAQTGPDGVATLSVPAAGRLELIATAAGMVRSFPREVTAG